MGRHVHNHTPSIITRKSLRVVFLVLQTFTPLAPSKLGHNDYQQFHLSTSIFGSLNFSFLSSPDLHLSYVFRVGNFVLQIAPWVCQPQIMLATLSVGVGFPLPFKQGFRWWNLSRYWVTGIRALFSLSYGSNYYQT